MSPTRPSVQRRQLTLALSVAGLFLLYLFLGGGRLDGRLVAAVLGQDRWVQGVAGWLWAATAMGLVVVGDRPGRARRWRRAVLGTAAAMAFFALTIVPVGKGAGGTGEASAALGGGAEAPGFALGLVVAVPTVPLAYRFLTRHRRARQRADELERRRAGSDAATYGMPRSGGWLLHPDWLRPSDPPVYARTVREVHSIARDDLQPHELAFLEERMRLAGRGPVADLSPRGGPRAPRRGPRRG